jgi:DNA helicase TIP49 (TBP-interacting protein)
MGIRKTVHDNFPPEVAANGLIDRRVLLGRGVLIAGAMGTGVSASPIGAAADPLPVDVES